MADETAFIMTSEPIPNIMISDLKHGGSCINQKKTLHWHLLQHQIRRGGSKTMYTILKKAARLIELPWKPVINGLKWQINTELKSLK